MNSYREIIIAPLVTEKTNDLKEKNTYVFKVKKTANKTAIKQAVEKIFNVKVKNVNTINTKPKKKRVGRYSGMTKAYKKAFVSLEEGSSIDLE